MSNASSEHAQYTQHSGIQLDTADWPRMGLELSFNDKHFESQLLLETANNRQSLRMTQ